MRRPLSVLSISGAVLLLASALAAQTRPDFSGVWVSVTPQNEDFQNLEVKQDAVTLTEIRGGGGESHTMTYKLDGTESRTAIRSHDKEIVSLTTARWDGASLVLTTVTTFAGGNKATIRQVWSFDAEKQLVAEMTRRSDRGGTTPPKTIKVVYRKR